MISGVCRNDLSTWWYWGHFFKICFDLKFKIDNWLENIRLNLKSKDFTYLQAWSFLLEWRISGEADETNALSFFEQVVQGDHFWSKELLLCMATCSRLNAISYFFSRNLPKKWPKMTDIWVSTIIFLTNYKMKILSWGFVIFPALNHSPFKFNWQIWVLKRLQ